MNGKARNVIAFIGRSAQNAVNVPDQEFVGAELELLANPPSPVHLKLVLVICTLFAIALATACLNYVDIHAVAAARIQPTGRSKVVQPLEPGTVRSVEVKNGSHVQEGDTLLELDPTEIAADRETNSDQLETLDAEIARRNIAAEVARGPRGAPISPIHFGDGIDEAVQAREIAVLEAEIRKLRSTLDFLDARIGENDARKVAAKIAIKEQELLVANLQQRVEVREKLQNRGLESQANVLDAQNLLLKDRTALANQKGELLLADAAINSLRRQKEDTVAEFVLDNARAMAVAWEKHDIVAQSLVKTSARLERTRLRAPISGTVQELAITTIGQVVTGAQQLMVIVPDSATLEAEALVLNRDIGFVEVDQTATIKIDAFPFTRYGTLSGKVVRVSNDAVDARELLAAPDRSAAAAAAQGQSTSATPGTQNLVYPVTVELDQAMLRIDGKDVALTPGMSARVEIKTGERRLIEYLLAPLLQVTSETAHER